MGLERPGTWVVLIVVVVVLFGAKRLPDSAKALGRSLKIFRNEIKDQDPKKESDSSEQ
ncbi:MAG: twin-arginine translocase TatA/TatE family subunit [Actinobacteria bacterium]|jgi:sec-independent protein translocase protein TatA|nr:twin-arginine translocase TatA/TatE family subunit [Actinomycetota bacterium]NBP90973.1 twin-arginine translocase TatA/TatE family subunit [Actinomycetota bacterium]